MTDFEGLSKTFREQRGGTVVYNDNINPYRRKSQLSYLFFVLSFLKDSGGLRLSSVTLSPPEL